MRILMIAAENDALPGGKVGGIGDVIRDLPPALAQLDQQTAVVTPGYGQLSKAEGARKVLSFSCEFAGREEVLELYRIDSATGVVNWVLEHELFAAGGPGTIYCTRDREPFATDASKFALFCSAVAEALLQGHLGPVDVLHCHDWHAAPLLLLRAASQRYSFLRELPAVYTIHNLSIQGVRPLADNRSSLAHWFPDLNWHSLHALITDPRYQDCINWMRCGINLADRVHAVSPTYAREILQPTDEARHFIGGEHLENDLQRAFNEQRLVGILNGCDYSKPVAKPVGKGRLCQLMVDSLQGWVAQRSSIPSAHFHALYRIQQWRSKRKAESFVVTSIGRLTDQKNRLLREQLGERSVLERLLAELEDGFFILLGSGDASYEQFFTEVMARSENFIFLQGYSDELSQALYSYGDLFLMPSSFEPCGISQMLAMRAGTPCLVHAVGGLADTVEDGVNGFCFSGDNLQQQADNLLSEFRQAMALKAKAPRWREICQAASAARFSWQSSAQLMLDHLYAERASDRQESRSKLERA